MSVFRRKPKPCEICRMRGYHDHDVHRVHARELVRDIKSLRRELDDDTLGREFPYLARRYELSLIGAQMEFEDETQILGLAKPQIEEMIRTA